MKTTRNLRSTSTVTPEMIRHYRHHLRLQQAKSDWLTAPRFASLGSFLQADPYSEPFVMQIVYPIYPNGQVAYLSLQDGTPQWRYHETWVRYSLCPVVRDPVLVQWLDGLFAAFYLEAGLPASLGYSAGLPGPEDRVRWVRACLFESDRTDEALHREIDSWVYDLRRTDPLKNFLSWVACTLLADGRTLRYTAFDSTGDRTADFYALRYGEREAYAYPGYEPDPVRYLASILNEVLHPDYELRRFRDPRLGKDGILMPLSRADWDSLADAFGPMTIEARFQPVAATR